ncbi:MAG: hypothetical protein NVSMB57_09260 [Actinomycetota bacterium]
MNMRRLLPLAALAMVLASISPAHADGTPIFASTGDRVANTFTTPVVVTPVGGPLLFVNGDVQAHKVVSDLRGPDTLACRGVFAKGACPLFWTLSTDAGFRTNAVNGLERVVAGMTYGFHCELHPGMRGTLVAV